MLLLSLTQHGSPLPGGHLASLHFFSCVVDKNPVWLRNICAAAPAQSHGSNPAPANLCREPWLVLGWPLGMLWGHPCPCRAIRARGQEQTPRTNGWTDGRYGLGVDLLFYHLLFGLCSRSKVLEVRQGLN